MKHLQADLSTYAHRTNPATPAPLPLSSTSIRHVKVYYTSPDSSIVRSKTLTYSEFLETQERNSFAKCLIYKPRSFAEYFTAYWTAFDDLLNYPPECVSVNRLECYLIVALRSPNFATVNPSVYQELLETYPEYFI